MNYLRYLALAKNEAEKVSEDDKPSTRIKVSTLKIKKEMLLGNKYFIFCTESKVTLSSNFREDNI